MAKRIYKPRKFDAWLEIWQIEKEAGSFCAHAYQSQYPFDRTNILNARQARALGEWLLKAADWLEKNNDK